MTIYQKWLNGEFQELVTRKIISKARARYFEIYQVFLFNRQTLGYKKALEKTIDDCCTNISTVKSAIKMVSK